MDSWLGRRRQVAAMVLGGLLAVAACSGGQGEPPDFSAAGLMSSIEEHFELRATIHAMARAAVDFTGTPTYDAMLRRVFAAHRTHLVAGTRSRPGWDVPEWAIDSAATYQALPDSGHLMMLEQPHRLATLLATLVSRRCRTDG